MIITTVLLKVQFHLSQAQTQLQQNRDQLDQSQKELHQVNNSKQVGMLLLIQPPKQLTRRS